MDYAKRFQLIPIFTIIKPGAVYCSSYGYIDQYHYLAHFTQNLISFEPILTLHPKITACKIISVINVTESIRKD